MAEQRLPKWLTRLHEILSKVGLKVMGLAAYDDELDIAIEGGSGRVIVIELRPFDGSGRWIVTTERSGIRCRTGGLEGPDRAVLDLAVKVLCRLEPRLPVGRQGFASIGVVPEDPKAPVPRTFPFVSIEHSETNGRMQTEVMVRLGPACNQACPFCSTPPHKEPLWSLVEAGLEWAAERHPGCRLVLSGGEPTLSRWFEKALARALEIEAFEEIEVQTNAVPLARDFVLKTIPDHDRLVFFVSLHAIRPDIYDLCTGTSGQLPLAIKGLKALLERGCKVRVNAVVSSLNLHHIGEYVTGLRDILGDQALPTIHFSSLMCPPYKPEAAQFMVRYSEMVPVLKRATDIAKELGFDVDPLISSTHASVPPCLVAAEHHASLAHRPEPSGGETGYEDFSKPWVKASRCKDCRFASRCLGLPNPYAVKFGFDELSPILSDELVIRITRQTCDSLKSGLPEGKKTIIEIPRVEDIGPEDAPLSLSEVIRFAESLRHPAQIRSLIGRPLCLFGESLMRVLLGHPGPKEGVLGGEAVFGPQCDSCRLKRNCSGVSAAYARTFGFGELRPFEGEPTWDEIARWLLIGRPAAAVKLKELLPVGKIPDLPCVLPWIRLEMHEGGTFGPCCADYMVVVPEVSPGANIHDLWNSVPMKEFRRALASGDFRRTCRDSCPFLLGGLNPVPEMRMVGGEERFVQSQIEAVKALIERRDNVDTSPIEFAFSATSYCNYDCLMCDCGERGTLNDEKDEAFYALVEQMGGGCRIIEVNGGEPFASARFRAFVERLAERGDRPILTVVTNGALLTSGWLERLKSLPFAGIVVSLNAASPITYQRVNRGIPFENIRKNLEGLLRLRHQGRLSGGLTWSMVVIKSNLHEVVAFARMGIEDGVEVRYLLPIGDRNAESVLTDRGQMMRAREALLEAADLLESSGRSGRSARACARVIEERLKQGVVGPIDRSIRKALPIR